jgi:hypothetical protein
VMIGQNLSAPICAPDRPRQDVHAPGRDAGQFGSISVFGRSLEGRLGGMSDDAVADLFRSTATVASDSDVEFTPTNHPTAGRPMTPRDELTAVVGTACHRNVDAQPGSGSDLSRLRGRPYTPGRRSDGGEDEDFEEVRRLRVRGGCGCAQGGSQRTHHRIGEGPAQLGGARWPSRQRARPVADGLGAASARALLLVRTQVVSRQ